MRKWGGLEGLGSQMPGLKEGGLGAHLLPSSDAGAQAWRLSRHQHIGHQTLSAPSISSQDLRSLTRDRTRVPLQWKRGVLTTGLPRKSLLPLLNQDPQT